MCSSRGGGRGQLRTWPLLEEWPRIKTFQENRTQPPVPHPLSSGGQGREAGDEESKMPECLVGRGADRWAPRLHSPPVSISSFKTQLYSQGWDKGTWWQWTEYLCHPSVADRDSHFDRTSVTGLGMASLHRRLGAITYFPHRSDRICDRKKFKGNILILDNLSLGKSWSQLRNCLHWNGVGVYAGISREV